MTTTGNAVYSTSKSPNAGFVLYPKEIVVSSTVEALLLVRITPGTFTGYQPQTMLEYQFPVKARETQRVTFEGEMAVVGLGKIEIGYKNTSADGLFYGTIFGVEVANNA
ncbi:hypothetical protein SAMN02799630_01231 [Paenibacillus sp. UNCCL117]|nr:hypothetical protein SAMN04488602_103209 [Paenibacillus sp. cl123]SFW24168.1 hypothetical protein SAMN02799630_01231 [Paenibacillus sp. UNCCL117]